MPGVKREWYGEEPVDSDDDSDDPFSSHGENDDGGDNAEYQDEQQQIRYQASLDQLHTDCERMDRKFQVLMQSVKRLSDQMECFRVAYRQRGAIESRRAFRAMQILLDDTRLCRNRLEYRADAVEASMLVALDCHRQGRRWQKKKHQPTNHGTRSLVDSPAVTPPSTTMETVDASSPMVAAEAATAMSSSPCPAKAHDMGASNDDETQQDASHRRSNDNRSKVARPLPLVNEESEKTTTTTTLSQAEEGTGSQQSGTDGSPSSTTTSQESSGSSKRPNLQLHENKENYRTGISPSLKSYLSNISGDASSVPRKKQRVRFSLEKNKEHNIGTPPVVSAESSPSHKQQQENDLAEQEQQQQNTSPQQFQYTSMVDTSPAESYLAPEVGLGQHPGRPAALERQCLSDLYLESNADTAVALSPSTFRYDESSADRGISNHSDNRVQAIVDLAEGGKIFRKFNFNIKVKHSYGRPREMLDKLLVHNDKFGLGFFGRSPEPGRQGPVCGRVGRSIRQLVLNIKVNHFIVSQEELQQFMVLGQSPQSRLFARSLAETETPIAIFYDPNQKKSCIHYIGHFQVVPQSIYHYQDGEMVHGSFVSMYVELGFSYFDERLASAIQNGDNYSQRL